MGVTHCPLLKGFFSMLKSEGDRLTRVVVCSPGKEYFDTGNLEAHNIAERADPEKAKAQHNQLKSALKAFGAEVIDVDELPGHPNSVFTRDSAVCTPRGYIQLRMGLESRRGEDTWMAKTLSGMGEPCAGAICSPGTAEGGDIILAGSVAFIGCSKRTNKAGARQLSQMFQKMGYETRVANIPLPHFHLGGLMSLAGPEQLLCCKGYFDRNFFKGFDRVEVEDLTFISGNVICLGEGELIAEASNTAAIEALTHHGFTVHALNLSEFVKGQGGPSCLILPLERKD